MTGIYDDPQFFKHYQHMPRSQKGLAAAGEWPDFKGVLPDLNGKTVLDVGCGNGWHCRYAADNGATDVLGIDISQKMLTQAREQTADDRIHYQQGDLFNLSLPANHFDVIISSLMLHYVDDYLDFIQKVHDLLTPKGVFQFTVEHPIFTAEGSEQWVTDAKGQLKYWPVDHYFDEGERTSTFLDTQVTKYHHTLTTFVDGLLTHGFALQRLIEPQPAKALRHLPEMQPSLRVPMMLIIKAKKI